MLLWQPRITLKAKFALKLVCIIVFFHLFLLVLAVIVVGGAKPDLKINLHAPYTQVDVLFIPWLKEPARTAGNKLPAASVEQQSKPKTATVAHVPKPKAPAAKEAKPDEGKKEAVCRPVDAKTKSVQPEKSESQEAVQEQPIYVTKAEFDAIQLQDMIIKELKRVWAPPAGLDPDLEAILTISFDLQGKMTAIEIIQESGVPVYDIQAYIAATSLQLGKACFGRNITISFKQ